MTAAGIALASQASAGSTKEAPCRSVIPGPTFWAFFISSTLFALSFSIYFFLYSVYLVDLSFSEAQIGRITAALTVGSILGTLPVGLAATRYGIRNTVIVCVPIAAALSALRVCVSAYEAQLLLGFASGFFLCAWAVCLAPSVAALCSQQTRTFAYSAIFASGIAMSGLGTLLASSAPQFIQEELPQFHSSLLNNRRMVALIGCAAAAISILPLGFLPLAKRIAAPHFPVDIKPFLLRFLPAVALWTFASAAFAPFVTVFFTRHLGVSIHKLGFLLATSQIAQASGVLIGPVISRKWGLARSMIAAQLAAACALGLLAWAKSFVVMEVLYWAYIGCTCLSEPCLYSIVMSGVPTNQRPAASTAHQLVSGSSVVFSAVLMGSIIGALGYTPAFCLLAAASVGAAALFYRLDGAAPVHMANTEA